MKNKIENGFRNLILVFFRGKTFVRDTWNSLVTADVQQKILSSVSVEIVSVILELDMHLLKTLKEKKSN